MEKRKPERGERWVSECGYFSRASAQYQALPTQHTPSLPFRKTNQDPDSCFHIRSPWGTHELIGIKHFPKIATIYLGLKGVIQLHWNLAIQCAGTEGIVVTSRGRVCDIRSDMLVCEAGFCFLTDSILNNRVTSQMSSNSGHKENLC